MYVSMQAPLNHFVQQGADVLLVVDGSGAGRGGTAQQDVMPPLMPGMKARALK